MAFAHSRRRWFGTCSCKPVPRGPTLIGQTVAHLLGLAAVCCARGTLLSLSRTYESPKCFIRPDEAYAVTRPLRSACAANFHNAARLCASNPPGVWTKSISPLTDDQTITALD